MDFRLGKKKQTRLAALWQALWLGAILFALADLLQWARYAPLLAPGPLLIFVSGKYRKKILLAIFGASLVYGLVRLECFGFVANRLFALSEAAQSYAYDYFDVAVKDPGEAFAVLSLMLGAAVALWGRPAALTLSGALLALIAYFGIAPGVAALLLLAAAAGISLSGRSLTNAVFIAAAVLVIAFFVTALAPKPISVISELDEHLRDVLSGNTVTYEHTPVPKPVPEPEIVPPPPESGQQPDRGILSVAINILFVLFSAAALAVLFIPAFIRDRAEKKRRRNRAFLEETDNSAAIREMYLYARKWRALDQTAENWEAEALFLEAAYSDHPMTDAQKETMRAYMKETARSVWQKADWKQKLRIKYKLAL